MSINVQGAALPYTANRIEFEGGASCNQSSFLKTANQDLVLGNTSGQFYPHLTGQRGKYGACLTVVLSSLEASFSYRVWLTKCW
jgi:hypothetical protein